VTINVHKSTKVNGKWRTNTLHWATYAYNIPSNRRNKSKTCETIITDLLPVCVESRLSFYEHIPAFLLTENVYRIPTNITLVDKILQNSISSPYGRWKKTLKLIRCLPLFLKTAFSCKHGGFLSTHFWTGRKWPDYND